MVSVIIPCFNAEGTIGRCVDSILCQTYQDFEVIIVDDGSSDSSSLICDEYAEKYDRIKVFHQRNKGVSSARNTGLNKSEGDFVCFVDSDDEVFPNYLEILIGGMREGVDLVMAGYNKYDSQGVITYSIPERAEQKISREQGVKLMYAPLYYDYWGYTWNKLYKLKIIRENKLKFETNIYYNEDRLFVVQYLCCQSADVYMNTAPIYKYYSSPSGAMSLATKSFNQKYVSDFYAYCKMKRLISKSFHNQSISGLANEGIWRSYMTIHYMMDRNGGCISSIHRKLKILLFITVPKSFLESKNFHLIG